MIVEQALGQQTCQQIKKSSECHPFIHKNSAPHLHDLSSSQQAVVSHCQEDTALVCRGLAERLNMPISGKRSALGTLRGPMHDPNLNGTHPALLAALRCNSDVQLPYRLPVNKITHNHVRGRVREDEPSNQHKMTMEVFELSKKIWLSDQDEIAILLEDFDDTS